MSRSALNTRRTNETPPPAPVIGREARLCGWVRVAMTSVGVGRCSARGCWPGAAGGGEPLGAAQAVASATNRSKRRTMLEVICTLDPIQDTRVLAEDLVR